MFNSETLEVGIGMAFMFLLISLICTGVKEWIEGIFKWRAMDLERAMRTILDDESGHLTAYLFSHPLISSLYQGQYDSSKLTASSLTSWLTGGANAKHMALSARRNLPSYIPADHFAKALIDIVGRGPANVDGEGSSHAPLTIKQLRERAAALSSPFLRRAVLSAIDYSAGDLKQLAENLQHWFDGSMDRASGWYKRRTQSVLFVLGLGAAVILNVDALYVMSRLTADKTFRETVVSAAAKVEAPTPLSSGASAPSALDTAQKAREMLDQVGMPVGWLDVDSSKWWVPPLAPVQRCRSESVIDNSGKGKGTVATTCLSDRYSFGRMVLGWLMTAFAVMLGAPFWFDILNKFMVIRSTVKPHEKSREEGSEDRTDAASKDAMTNPVQASPAPAPPSHPGGEDMTAETPPLPQTFVPHEWRDGVVNPKEVPL